MDGRESEAVADLCEAHRRRQTKRSAAGASPSPYGQLDRDESERGQGE
jgi:hypothetical protein